MHNVSIHSISLVHIHLSTYLYSQIFILSSVSHYLLCPVSSNWTMFRILSIAIHPLQLYAWCHAFSVGPCSGPHSYHRCRDSCEFVICRKIMYVACRLDYRNYDEIAGRMNDCTFLLGKDYLYLRLWWV